MEFITIVIIICAGAIAYLVHEVIEIKKMQHDIIVKEGLSDDPDD